MQILIGLINTLMHMYVQHISLDFLVAQGIH